MVVEVTSEVTGAVTVEATWGVSGVALVEGVLISSCGTSVLSCGTV